MYSKLLFFSIILSIPINIRGNKITPSNHIIFCWYAMLYADNAYAVENIIDAYLVLKVLFINIDAVSPQAPIFNNVIINIASVIILLGKSNNIRLKGLIK